jgi:hypothetical protein
MIQPITDLIISFLKPPFIIFYSPLMAAAGKRKENKSAFITECRLIEKNLKYSFSKRIRIS